MTIGVGGSTAEVELSKLSDMTQDILPISREEHQARIAKAVSLMKQHDVDALYLNAGMNLYYFTGTHWRASERMVAAILTASGELHYILPKFEIGTFETLMLIEGTLHLWDEHENPYALAAKVIDSLGLSNGILAVDESTAFFLVDGIAKANPSLKIVNANNITCVCRSTKSDHEIAIMQRANDMTITVQKAVARILREGITTTEVADFIHRAHQAVGAKAGSAFVIVLFGPDTAFPHGVRNPKALEKNDVVLIDTGCRIYSYFSDITRSYVFGEPTEEQRKVWNDEKAAQQVAFQAAKIGVPCESVDAAVREFLKDNGYGPDYDLPGVPHRTGHGIGLDIHESPYLVGNDKTPMQKGMCFSNEPMICMPGKFGIRHEDHFYMIAGGPKWFTKPMHSIDDPFAISSS